MTAIPQELTALVAKLLRDMPRNPDIIALSQQFNSLLASQSNQTLDKANKTPFDKRAYQRDLMRKRRAAEKRRRQQESKPAEI